MKKNYVKKLLTVTVSAALIVGALTGCGSSNEAATNDSTTTQTAASAETASDETTAEETTADAAVDAREVIVAVAPGFYPITYADDDGNAQGYDVEVFKALDELLPEYTFKYEVADKETMNVGVQAGTYQVGINSLFKTQARTETYYMPENNMGFTPVGIIQREDDNITDLSVAFKDGRSIYQVLAAGGIRFVLDDWNAAHPDEAIDYELTTEFSYADMFAAIKAGDADYDVDLIPVFNLQSEEVVGGLKITDPIAVVPTYPIVNQAETELGDAINAGLATLKEDGTLSKLSNDAFGYDVFAISAE